MYGGDHESQQRVLAAAVTGSWEPPDMGAGTELGSPGKAKHTLSH